MSNEKAPKELTEEEQLDLQIEAARKAREASVKPVLAADALKRKRQELADLEALVKAEEQYGPVETGSVGTVETKLGIVIVKPPLRGDYRKFTETDKPSSDTLQEYCTKCLVHPTPAVFHGMLKEQPGILTGVTTMCSRLAGFREVQIEKK